MGIFKKTIVFGDVEAAINAGFKEVNKVNKQIKLLSIVGVAMCYLYFAEQVEVAKLMKRVKELEKNG